MSYITPRTTEKTNDVDMTAIIKTFNEELSTITSLAADAAKKEDNASEANEDSFKADGAIRKIMRKYAPCTIDWNTLSANLANSWNRRETKDQLKTQPSWVYQKLSDKDSYYPGSAMVAEATLLSVAARHRLQSMKDALSFAMLPAATQQKIDELVAKQIASNS